MSYTFADLFSKSIKEKNDEYLERIPHDILDNIEISVIEWAATHKEKHGQLPSRTLCQRNDNASMFISSILPKDPIKTVFALCLDWLKTRHMKRELAYLEEESIDTGIYPINQLHDVAAFLQSIQAESSIATLSGFDRDDAYSLDPSLTRLDTGFESLDKKLGGILSGEMCLFAARPGVGKSQMLCHLALKFVREGKRVLFMSVEMSEDEIIRRIDGLIGKFNPQLFRNNDPSLAKRKRELQARVENELEIIAEGGGELLFPPRGTSTFVGLEAAVKNLKPDVVFVDGIYLVKERHTSFVADWTNVKAVSTGVKRMAKEHGIPIIVTNQFNRRAATGDGIAGLEDLAYSDALGQDSDIVVAMTMSQDEIGHAIDLNVLKNRNGPQNGGATIVYDWKKMTIEESRLITHLVMGGGKDKSDSKKGFDWGDDD